MTSSILTVCRPAGRLDGAEQVLGVHDADDVVGLAAIERDARVGRRQHLGDDRIGRLVGVDQHDVAAMGHDVAHRAVAEIEHRAQHRLLGGRVLVGLARRRAARWRRAARRHAPRRRGVRSTCTPSRLQEEARDPGDAARHRAQDRQRHDDRRRQRSAPRGRRAAAPRSWASPRRRSPPGRRRSTVA